MMAKCSSFILLKDLAYHNDSISKRTKSAKRGWIPRIFGIKQEVEFEEDLGGEKRRYWMWNSPMTRPVSLSVGWSVSRSVFHNFLKGREVLLPCSFRSTCNEVQWGRISWNYRRANFKRTCKQQEAEFNVDPRDFSFFKITFYKKQGNLGVIGAKRCNCYNGRAESRGRTDGKSYP